MITSAGICFRESECMVETKTPIGAEWRTLMCSVSPFCADSFSYMVQNVCEGRG